VRPPKAALVCVGSELLAGQVNTHQAWLSVRLRAAGFVVVGESSVPDDVDAISAALKRALSSADAVLVSGGLGPTFDDLTREAAAKALRRGLRFEPALWKKILRRFARYHVKVPQENMRQAVRIAGAKILDNLNGSAPGQFLTAGRKSLSLMPGPPSEMYPMFESLVLPLLAARHARNIHPVEFSVRLSGVPESVADERLDAVRGRWPKVRFTILASGGEVSFHASAAQRSAAMARGMRKALRADILAAVGEFAHGEGNTSLEAALGARLRKKGLTLAVAESCTGGMLGARLTSVPGASSWFQGGVIAYADSVKRNRLRVPAALISRCGAVSAECAAAMARGARRATGSGAALSITGVAGPGGGTKDKPVGLVFIAFDRVGAKTQTRRLMIHGPRETVRQRSTTSALRLAFDALG
jgi:nicotinamide-nucleotide amidase